MIELAQAVKAPAAVRAAVPSELLSLARRARGVMSALVNDDRLTNRCVETTFLLADVARPRFDLAVVAGVVWQGPRRRYVGHVWAELGAAILDLTATQFWRVSDVYVVDRSSDRYVHREALGEDVWRTVVRPDRARENLRCALMLAEREGLRGH